ncbi:LAFA_0F16952g1_1 [Lachancea sp. 'fantastica']|nr:LAFA_0F16952g1_1 [Lachancea sp. 'fantastica']
MLGLVISISFLVFRITVCHEWALQSYLYPKYSLNYIDQSEFDNTLLKDDLALKEGSIVTIGENTTCFVPDLKHWEVAKEALELNSQAKDEFEKSVVIINEELSGRYLERRVSLFLYRFYHNQNVSQSLSSEISYIAGLATTDPLLNDSFKLYQNTAGYYVKQIYEDGELCAGTNVLRTSEVRYLCDPNVGEPRLLEAFEYQLCRYELVVAVPGLCKLPLFLHGTDRQQLKSILYSEADLDKTTARIGRSLSKTFESHFLGHSFYHLKDRTSISAPYEPIKTSSKLLYTGELVLSDENSELHPTETVFLEKAIKAFQSINYKDLLQTPDGSRFTAGDYELRWQSEVIDKKGHTLCVLEVDVDAASRANVSFYRPDSLSVPITENIVHYSKVIHEDPASLEDLSGKEEVQKPDRAMSFDFRENSKAGQKVTPKMKKLERKAIEDLERELNVIGDSSGLEFKFLYAIEPEDDKPKSKHPVKVGKDNDNRNEPDQKQLQPVDQVQADQKDDVIEHDEL